MFTRSRSLTVPLLGLLSLSIGAGSLLAQDLPATIDGKPPEIQYPQTPLKFILQDFETVSGKMIVRDITALDIPITIETVHAPATNAEWLDFMERSLLLNGIALIPTTDNILKAVNWRAGSTPTREGIETYSEEYDIPDGEVVINYIMKLEFVTTDEAIRIFQEVTKNAATPYAAITAVPDVNMLVITENALVVRQLVELKNKIDVKPAQVKTQVFQLLRAEASVVSAAINDILSQQQEQRAGSAGNRTGTTRRTTPQATNRPPGTGGAAAASAAPSPTGGPGTTQPIVVYPDERTNRLIVIGRPLDVVYIENLIKELDAEVEVKRFINRALRHVSVQLALPVLADALTPRGEAGAGGGSALSSNLGGGRNTNNRSTGLGGSNRNSGFGNTGGFNSRGGSSFGGSNFGSSSGGFGGSSGFGGGGFGGGGGGLNGFGIQDSGPISVPIGVSTLLIADPKINTIIATGPPEDLLLVNTIIDEIDVKPRQVYISTIIGQVTLGDDVSWGVDLLHRVQEYEVGGRTVRSGGMLRGGDGALIDVNDLTDIANFPTSGVAGLSVYGQIGDYVNAYLQALETTDRFEIISRPSIYLSNNRPGTIVSGREVAVPSSTQSGGLNTSGVTSNIQYRRIALELNVVPLINSNEEVTLQIFQKNDTTSGFTDINGIQVPDVNTQQLQTEVTVPNKSTVVLGGLITESRQDGKTGLPLLVHVPLLKHIFGSHNKSKDRQELLVFIQPQIVNSEEDLVDANIEQTQNNRVTRGALEFNKRSSDLGAPVNPVNEADQEQTEPRERRNLWQRLTGGNRRR
ncbi:hypothetical protein N9V84_07520 [Verrucomicrobiales bacterium]|jgi:type II secretion system protein D|nr:hypothetical protein [Verrucomicrobiales bacterium]